MTTIYFGRRGACRSGASQRSIGRWDAPMLEDAEQAPTPTKARCYLCGESIAAGDRGLMRAHVRMDDGRPAGSVEPVHTECDLLAILGHQYGVCGCTGHGTSRADGLELLRRLNEQRAADGIGPL